MLLDTTGLRKEVENLGKSMVSTGEPLIFGSAPPILMPHPCASKVEESIWAITRKTLVDGGKRRIILAVLVTAGEVMDNQPMLDLLWHVYFRWRVRPRHVTGDTKYATIENIKAIEDAHIRAFVPLPDWEHKTSYYGPAQFTYDAVHDQYRCPEAASAVSFSPRRASTAH
jgi:hypothetical protein